MMRTLDDKVALARQCLAFCDRLGEASARGASATMPMRAMSAWRHCAIVPVKALAQAKRRLAPVLPDAARRRLVLTMLEDVLAAARRVEGIDRVLVVTPDRERGATRARAGAR